MQEVEKRAQEVITGMITAMGYNGYDIRFGNQREPAQLEESHQHQSNPIPTAEEAAITN